MIGKNNSLTHARKFLIKRKKEKDKMSEKREKRDRKVKIEKS